MKLIKKLWKEVSVFGLVFVVFLALFAYRQATHVEIATLTKSELKEKLTAKDSFVVVLGSDDDSTTTSYKEICVTYMEKNRSDTIYYVNLANEDDAAAYIQKTMDTDDGTLPSTFVVKKGKVQKQKSGSLSYYRIAELFQ